MQTGRKMQGQYSISKTKFYKLFHYDRIKMLQTHLVNGSYKYEQTQFYGYIPKLSLIVAIE